MPQGLVLSPLFFVNYINYLDENIVNMIKLIDDHKINDVVDGKLFKITKVHR